MDKLKYLWGSKKKGFKGSGHVLGSAPPQVLAHLHCSSSTRLLRATVVFASADALTRLHGRFCSVHLRAAHSAGTSHVVSDLQGSDASGSGRGGHPSTRNQSFAGTRDTPPRSTSSGGCPVCDTDGFAHCRLSQ